MAWGHGLSDEQPLPSSRRTLLMAAGVARRRSTIVIMFPNVSTGKMTLAGIGRCGRRRRETFTQEWLALRLCHGGGTGLDYHEGAEVTIARAEDDFRVGRD